jgi:thiamine kinase-like enzyme
VIAPTPEQLRVVQNLLGWDPCSFECRELAGGLNNRSFELVRGLERYLLRIRTAVGGAALVSAECECRLLQVIAAAGIGPEVRASHAEAGILVSEFLATARPWTAGAVRSAGNIARAAQLLRRLHAVDFALPPFDLRAVLARYLDSAPTACETAAELESWQQELRVLAHWYGQRFESIAVCHNDLVADNILDDGNRLWLIDFEYAARAHPILDLANFAAMNGLEAPARAALCAAYYGSEQPPFGQQELARVVRMQRLLAYFWVLWSSRVVPVERDWQVHRAAWGDSLRQGDK